MGDEKIEYEVVKKVFSLEALVESKSVKGSFYKVSLNDGNWICSCPDFTHRQAFCKHINAVRHGEF